MSNAVLTDPTRDAAVFAPSPTAGIRGWEPRVLVVDDDPVCRIAAQTLLRKLGLTVDIAVDGRHALTMSAEWPYVAIFMDCLMPEVDGYQAAREIRSRVGVRRSPVVIAVTEHSRHVALAAGMDHHIAKPLRAERLAADCLALGLRPTGERLQAGPVPDVPALELRPGLPPSRTAELAMEFVERARQNMPELWRAANLRDAGGLARGAQELRQRAQTFGASRVAEICAQIEDAAEAGHTAVAVALEPALRIALADTVAAVDALGKRVADPDDAGIAMPVRGDRLVRVAIADDDPLALLAIEKMIGRGERLRFVGSASSVEDIVELAETVRPDVAVVDFFMPGGGGPEAARRIRDRSPETRIVALTATDSPDAYLAMLRAGASGLVVKGSPGARLVQTIQRAADRSAG